jgi:hypothetical protein
MAAASNDSKTKATKPTAANKMETILMHFSTPNSIQSASISTMEQKTLGCWNQIIDSNSIRNKTKNDIDPTVWKHLRLMYIMIPPSLRDQYVIPDSFKQDFLHDCGL